MTFIRFVNQMTQTKTKLIGFEIIDNKEKIFDIMLQSLTDFTIPGSLCSLFYQNLNGETYHKQYYKKNNTNYYINGGVKNGINSIFKVMTIK